MQIENDIKLDFADVLIRPKRTTLSSRSQVDLTRTIETRHSKRELVGIPIVAANMDTVATFDMAVALAKQGLFTALHKYYAEMQLVDFFETDGLSIWDKVFYTIGMNPDDAYKLERVRSRLLEDAGPDLAGGRPVYDYFPHLLCIDVANGYTEAFVEYVKTFREKYPSSVIVAGNVVTKEMTEALVLAGADIVKVGIGSGSVCTTRSQAGVGYPQLSAIIECADAAHGMGAHIMADGGCKEPGDIAKAFGAGADFVMLGKMLAGHDENTEGENPEFYGMSSAAAQEKYHGGVACYRASEGISIQIPRRGPVDKTIQQILGGLRSACSYVGAKYLKQIHKRTTFIRVSRQKEI